MFHQKCIPLIANHQSVIANDCFCEKIRREKIEWIMEKRFIEDVVCYKFAPIFKQNVISTEMTWCIINVFPYTLWMHGKRNDAINIHNQWISAEKSNELIIKWNNLNSSERHFQNIARPEGLILGCQRPILLWW